MIEEINDLKWIPYFLVFLLVINPSFGDSNFSSIQRMIQFDSSGVNYGCRASSINKEARPLSSVYLSNGCVLARFQDMTIDQFREIRLKAGGLIILLPKNLQDLTLEEKENIFLLEQAMLVEEISIPVYFSNYDDEIDKIISEISQNPAKGGAVKQSAISEIFKKISANSYQIVVAGSHAPKKDGRIPIIQGELIPFKSSSDGQTKLPVIVISTQLKTFGISSSQPPNFDATIMLTLADLFSKLYNQITSSAKYRIVFVLDESGSLLNYQGAKKWLENNVDENIHNIEFAICLESFAESLGDIYMHVSKPPKEGTNIHRFYEILQKKTQKYSKKTLESVHKKINLADAFFKFPHERFSMKRISAFTLSSLRSHTDPLKTSMFTEHASTSVVDSIKTELNSAITENILTNAKILSETLASFIFNFNDEEAEEIFTGSMTITERTIKPYIQPKSLVKSNNLKLAFEKLLKNVKITYDVSTERDPDFMFYDGEEAKLNIYNVKPAVFDLFLTSLIGCYLFAIYFIVLHFPKVYTVISKFAYNPVVPATNGIHLKKAN